MRFKAVIFDLDGTLANTLPLCIKAYQYTLKEFLGRDFSTEEVTAHFGLNEGGIFQRLIPKRWEEALKYYYKVYEDWHYECGQPFEGVLELLKMLQERGIRMALVTGKSAYSAHYTLEYLKIARYFEIVEVGDANAHVKTEALRRILDHWQMSSEEATYVGDSDTDIHQAVAAGVYPIGAAWAETTTLYKHADVSSFLIFKTIPEFTIWLQGNTVIQVVQ